MALDDQTFLPKPIIALGPEFFCDSTGFPVYDFCLAFREAERLHVLWDFHFIALNGIRNAETLAILQGWGVPVQLGALYPETPTRELSRKAQRAAVSIELIHSHEFCQRYRIAGLRNISMIPPEYVFEALRDTSYDPRPGAFQEALLRLSLSNGQ